MENITQKTLKDVVTRWFFHTQPQTYDIQSLVDMIWKFYPPIPSIGTTGYRNALRLRQVQSRDGNSQVWVTCSAQETSPKDGDIYLYDEQRDALEAFFRQEFHLESPDSEREILMEREKAPNKEDERNM